MDIRDSPNLVKVKRLDTIRIDENDITYFTAEGYLIDKPILTTCGIFEYVNKDGSLRRELRLPEYVFEEASLKSYKGKPIIITHNAGVVDKNNVSRVEIGTILSTGYRDGENVRAEIVIHDTDAMVRSALKELSLGYELCLIEEPGVYNGQHYDAIQTNIRVNHLALVGSARAGEQAKLNIDGKDSDEVLKGGLIMNENNELDTLTPEEVEEAIKEYKKNKAESKTSTPSTDTVVKEIDGDERTTTIVEGEVDKDGEEKTEEGKSVTDLVSSVKDKVSTLTESEPTKEVVEGLKSNVDILIACIEKLLSDEKQEEIIEETNGDGEGCAEPKTVNTDEADTIIRQRLSICRIGDKLNLDGLENISIAEGKKKIISKVLPRIRLDGKSKSYLDACYELAVDEVNNRKSVITQKMEMQQHRTDSSAQNKSQAALARERMINRK